jgi:Ca2+-binding EF-hand superfamily protein
LHKQPINRNYYFVSVYDEDTNRDTLINRKDLRKFYHFDASGSVKTQLLPPHYSVFRSQYDSQNDVMYLFARFDTNKNGRTENKEPIHIFWLSLVDPQPAKRVY